MKRLLAVLMIFALLPSFGGCSKPKPKPTPTPQKSAAPVQKIQVSIGLWDLGQAVQGKPSGQIGQYFEDQFGIEFVPWPVTSSDWKDKISSAAAAGTLPDMFAQGIYDDRMLFKSLIDNKQIRDIPESIYKDYRYLGTLLYRYADTESVDGKMYFVPRTDMAVHYNNGNSVAIWYRLDWALESGIIKAGQAPSWQDFMKLMSYYANSDPDGNDVEDTWALTSAGPGLGGLKTAFLMPFGVRDWVLEGGKWIPGVLSSRAKEALKWANQAYRSGLIDPDFSTQSAQDAMDKFCSGKAGMLVADASPAGAELINEDLQLKQPGLDIRSAVSVLAEPADPWGVAYNEDASYSTGTVFNATVDDAKLRQIFTLMDWLYSSDGLTYLNWGVKGADYNVTGDGLQTLHHDASGLPVTFGRMDAEWAPMATLSTWGKDFIPGGRDDDYRLKYLETLQSFWWANDWRKPMFTKYIFDATVQDFDKDGRAEAALANMVVKSKDVEADWQAYVTQMTGELNADAVGKTVNDYAQKNKITKEE